MIELDRAAAATMDALWQYREAGEFDLSIELLRGLGHSPVAVEFALDPDNYYFPNRRGNNFVHPRGIDESKIPVFTLESGRVYTFEKPSLHYLQRIALSEAQLSHWAIRDADKEFGEQADSLSASGGKPGSASMRVRKATVRDLPDGQIESKPALIFNAAEGSTTIEPFCAGVAMHEVVHIAQTLSDPVRFPKQLRLELEAYAVQSQLIHSETVPYSMFTIMACEVDSFRQKYLGPDEFEPTDFFIQEFKREPILEKVWDRLE